MSFTECRDSLISEPPQGQLTHRFHLALVEDFHHMQCIQMLTNQNVESTARLIVTHHHQHSHLGLNSYKDQIRSVGKAVCLPGVMSDRHISELGQLNQNNSHRGG